MNIDRHKLEQLLKDLIHHNESKNIALYLYDTIDSTNQKAWELLKQEIQPPFVVIAHQQTAGRGQRGRQWLSSSGGLYLSIALLPYLNASQAYHLVFLSAWGIAFRLREYHIPVFLKWPNDFTLFGRKLGGIKSESKIYQEIITQAVIGVGINWTNPTPDIGINLQSFSTSIDSLEKLAALTIDGLLYGYQYYQTNGIEKLLSIYLTILQNQGQAIIINGCSGTIIGVTPQGKLKVRLQSPGATAEICLLPGTISLGYDR